MILRDIFRRANPYKEQTMVKLERICLHYYWSTMSWRCAVRVIFSVTGVSHVLVITWIFRQLKAYNREPSECLAGNTFHSKIALRNRGTVLRRARQMRRGLL